MVSLYMFKRKMPIYDPMDTPIPIAPQGIIKFITPLIYSKSMTY